MSSDEIQIHNLLGRMQWASDERAFDDYGALFTVDAVSAFEIAGGARSAARHGREAIVAGLRAIKENQSDQRRHQIGNVTVLESSGDHALVRSYVTVFATADGATRLVTTGWSLDRLLRVDGAWLVADHLLHVDAPF